MPTPRSKPIVFISYAPADEPEKPVEGEVKWLSFVTGHLRVAEEIGALEIWTEPLAPGADLGPEAQRKLRACVVFAPLVSAHSLAFGAVVGRQIAIIRERQSRGEGVVLYPLALTPTPETALDIENLRPAGDRPFSSYDAGERDRQMLDAADEIVEIAVDAGALKTKRRTRSPLSPLAPAVAAAADRPAAHSGVRDHRTRWLADEASPPGHGRDRGASVVARDGMSCSFCRMGRKRRRPVPGFDRRNPSSDRAGASRREISKSRQ